MSRFSDQMKICSSSSAANIENLLMGVVPSERLDTPSSMFKEVMVGLCLKFLMKRSSRISVAFASSIRRGTSSDEEEN